MSLDVDGEVTEPAFFSLPVQTVQHRGLSAGEAHLHHRSRCVPGGYAAASHFHGQRLHLGGRTTESASSEMEPFIIADYRSLNMPQQSVHDMLPKQIIRRGVLQ